MSNEELERIMNFIIERQEYTTAQLAKITEAHDRSAERLDDHDERNARFERSYVAIAQLLEKHDDQLLAVTEGLNSVTDRLAIVSHGLANVTVGLDRLTTLVDRYIAARGNGENGGA